MSKKNRKVKIIFGGESHDIDADVLVQSLVNYSIVAQEASNYISPESKVNIKIKATNKGSFELLFDVVASSANTLFSEEGVNLASGIVTIVGGMYGLKKWFSKNGEADSIERKNNNFVEIKNNNGSITVASNVFNVYQSSQKARESLKKTFASLKNAEEISDFEIIDEEDGKEIFSVQKEDFESMASDIGEVEQKKQKEIKQNQELSVFKIVFEKKHKWEFIYNGTRIYATLNDQDFIEKVSKGEIAFRSGDKMIANLEIVQVFNETANVFVNNEYFITKVLNHIPRSFQSQDDLGFELEP